jgi:GT2 family glycosyltransferase
MREYDTTPVPRVEVVLLNWNGWRDTLECLPTVYESDYPNFGVIVCDNASTDDSCARIREWAPQARRGDRRLTFREISKNALESDSGARDTHTDLLLIQTGDNRGFAGGNNVAIRHVIRDGGADYIWLLNNDTVVAPTTLSRLVARLESEPRLGAVGGVLLEHAAPAVIQEAGATYSPWHGMMQPRGAGDAADAPRSEPDRIDYITGGCMVVRANVVRSVGVLDERFFMYGEDVDWGIRIRRAGFGLALEMSADVWHKGGSSAEYGSALHDYFSVKSALLLVQKQHAWRLPVAFVYSLYRCLLPKVVRLQGGRFVAVLKAYRDAAREILRPKPTDNGESTPVTRAPIARQW